MALFCLCWRNESEASWNKDKNIQFTTDYEPYTGRKSYAENCAGGWYSVRMAITEHLHQIKKQSSCLAIRVITGEYAMPLGVWVIRNYSVSGTLFGPRTSSMFTLSQNLKYTFDTLLAWYLPNTVTWHRSILMALSVVTGFVIARHIVMLPAGNHVSC